MTGNMQRFGRTELNAVMSRESKSFERDWGQLRPAICWTVFALGLLVQVFSPQLKSGIKPTSFKPMSAIEVVGERHLYAVTSSGGLQHMICHENQS